VVLWRNARSRKRGSTLLTLRVGRRVLKGNRNRETADLAFVNTESSPITLRSGILSKGGMGELGVRKNGKERGGGARAFSLMLKESWSLVGWAASHLEKDWAVLGERESPNNFEHSGGDCVFEGKERVLL